MFKNNPWPQILSDDRVKVVLYDDCMRELRDAGGLARTTPTREQALHVASCWELALPCPQLQVSKSALALGRKHATQ